MGAAVLGLAIIAALAGNARTKVVDGVADRGEVAGPPAVGACITAPVTIGWEVGQDHLPVYPIASYGPCGARYGEIAAVVPEALTHPVDPNSTVADPLGPNSICLAPSMVFLGLPADDLNQPEYGRWHVSINVTIGPVAPNKLQQAFGQDWIGCAILPGDGTQSVATPGARYDQSLHDAFRHSPYPQNWRTAKISFE